VRRVTQDNQGKKTAGVDGVKSLSPAARLKLIGKLRLGTKVKPTRRVWIPKPGTEEKRPLGIPTMYDRALQALTKLALEPEWEAKFEPNSYGFRPGRSCHDAIEAIFGSIKTKPKYVLDADIAKCFDRINHGKLLEKLNTFPTLRKLIRAWLKAGVMDGKELFPTEEGTPQGGVISPLLANIALHGMEEKAKELSETFDMKRSGGKYQLPKRDKRSSISLIRYADDFVILHESEEAIHQCQQVIAEWLKEMGLELKSSKTRIAHSLNPYQGEEKGFNFLGFRIDQYKAGKCRSGKDTKGNRLGFKNQISPSKESIKRHYAKIAEVIEKYRGQSQALLIKKLNPIIIGWCNYFKAYQCSKAFSKINSLVFWKLWKWGKHRHRNKGDKWLRQKYWHTLGGDKWVFSTRENNNPLHLVKHTAISSNLGYIKVKGDASPFDGNLTYWSTRMGKHPEMPKRLARLLKRQKGKCNHCGLQFLDGGIIEVDHIIPKSNGGKDEYKNWQLLHRHCHDSKTASDGSSGDQSDCNSTQPKPLSLNHYQWINDMLVVT
jgi:RNA-directed DNA polymerase